MTTILRRSGGLLAVAGLLFVVMTTNAASAPLTYWLTNFGSLQNGWTVTGHITTDGTIGTLGQSNITAWDYTATDGGSTFTGASTTSGAFINNFTDISADSTNFLINGEYGDLMLVADADYSNLINWSYNLNMYNGQAPAGTLIWNSDPSGQYVGGNWAIASSAVPEIDPAGIGWVLALVTGALGLLERRRLKTA